MKLTAAQKQKRYRENMIKKGRHNAMKAKNLERMKNVRSELSDFQREKYRKLGAVARKNARAANKRQSKYVIFTSTAYVKRVICFIFRSASFGSKQSFGKAVKKVTRCLPQDPTKKS